MEHLRRSDLRALLGFIRDCYAIREFKSVECLARYLVHALPGLIPAIHVTYSDMQPLLGKSYNIGNTSESNSPKAADRWQQHMDEHPVLIHQQRTGDQRALNISDFWSRRRLHNSGLYSGFYRHYDMEDSLCVMIPCRSPRVLGIGWHDDRPFTERERLLADLVRPHIGQAWQNAQLISRMQSQSQTFQRGIESVGTGLIVCSPKGHVRFVNTLARRYLAEYFAMSRESDRRLPDELLCWMRRGNAQINGGGVPPVQSPLVRERENRRLVLRLLLEPETNLILMEEERTPAGISFPNKFGLTPRETEVLGWIAQGKTNPEIAIILKLQMGTVKKHVEHIIEKLGVENRTGAASLALAAQLPPENL